MPAATQAVAAAKTMTAQSRTSAPGAFNLKQGERIGAASILIGQGATSLRGRVAPANESAGLPARLRVYLVPTEQERALNILRYAETSAGADGRFAFSHIAPGRYWLLARAESVKENEGEQSTLAALDATERDALRREAESAGAKIELSPCQRLADYVLNYSSNAAQTIDRK